MAVNIDAKIVNTLNQHTSEAQQRVAKYADVLSSLRTRGVIDGEVASNAHTIIYSVTQLVFAMATESRAYQAVVLNGADTDEIRDNFVSTYTESAMNVVGIIDTNESHLIQAHRDVVASGDDKVDVSALGVDSLARITDNLILATNSLHPSDVVEGDGGPVNDGDADGDKVNNG